MKTYFPQNKGMGNQVMLITAPIFSFLVNYINFGTHYFSGFWHFILTSLVAFLWFCINFIICGAIADFFKIRFPSEPELAKRLAFMIVAFLITIGLLLFALLNLYESIPYLEYRFNEKAFAWSYLVLGILGIFITFLMEGISRYKEWQLNRLETEKLNQVYKKSQLQGLKSQVNPHFLFNSLNSLSCLIQDDEERAEKFLDEMSKVYRYMLSTDNEQLVTLETELKFADSYIFLLKVRFGDGLQLSINVSDEDRTKFLAPLTLQLLIENAFSQNIICKTTPLFISISSNGNSLLEIKNNSQPKHAWDTVENEAALDNLIKKYELLGRPILVDEASNKNRVIRIPLINEKEVS